MRIRVAPSSRRRTRHALRLAQPSARPRRRTSGTQRAGEPRVTINSLRFNVSDARRSSHPSAAPLCRDIKDPSPAGTLLLLPSRAGGLRGRGGGQTEEREKKALSSRRRENNLIPAVDEPGFRHRASLRLTFIRERIFLAGGDGNVTVSRQSARHSVG